MVLSLVALTPFPEIPGAVALGVPVDATGRHNIEPALFMSALDDLHRDAGVDARPIAWWDALETDSQAQFDLADAFAASGLRRWTEDRQSGAVSCWALHGKAVTLAQVAQHFWLDFRAAVLAALDARQEMAGVARERIRSALRSRRDAEARKLDAQALDYLKRSSWPVPVALHWIAERDLAKAFQSLDDLRGEMDWDLMSDLQTLVHAQELGVSVDLDESSPFEVLLRACRQQPGMLIGRAPGYPDFAAIDVLHLESGALRFEGATYDTARSGDVEWSGVCVDRSLLWGAFPPPAVMVMVQARSMFAAAIVSSKDENAGDEWRRLLAEARAWVNQRALSERLYWAHLVRDVTKPQFGVSPSHRKRTYERLQTELKRQYPDRWNEGGRAPKTPPQRNNAPQ